MTEPKARFFPGDEMTVTFGDLVVHCSYWVEWGDDIWRVQVKRAEDRSGRPLPSCERITEVIKEALRGGKNRRILIENALAR